MTDSELSFLINMILVNEDVRPAYLFYGDKTFLKSISLYCPDLNIYPHRSSYFISKKILSHNDIATEELTGKTLGYPSYQEFKSTLHSDKYNLTLWVHLKCNKKIYDIDLFNYVTLTNNDSIESFVQKANALISKLCQILETPKIKIYKFYSTSDFYFNVDISYIVLGMLVDSEIIPFKTYKYSGRRQTYIIELIHYYFPHLLITKENNSTIISKHSVPEFCPIHDSMYQYDLNAIIYNDFYQQEMNVCILYSPMNHNTQQFNKLIFNSTQIINKYPHLLQKFKFQILKFNVRL
jgi:hypothetical protein